MGGGGTVELRGRGTATSAAMARSQPVKRGLGLGDQDLVGWAELRGQLVEKCPQLHPVEFMA